MDMEKDMNVEMPEMPSQNEKKYLTGVKLHLLLASLTLIMFMMLLDISIIGTAIPRITSQFQSLQDVGWYVGAYMLAAATLQPLSGKLYLHFDTKVVYLVFIFVFEVGSLICGIAQSSVMFIIGRTIAGLGGSGLINGSMTILAGAVPLHKSPVYQGILFGFGQIGTLSGPLIGGALTDHASWRWCFYMNLPIGAVAAFTIFLMSIPGHTKKPTLTKGHCYKALLDLDPIGFVLFVPPSIMFLLALQLGSGNALPWSSPTIICLFCFAGITAVTFIFWEWRMGDKAMIPGSMLRNQIVWTSSVYAMCVTCNMTVASNWLPTYFQAVRGESPTTSGVHLLPSILSQITFLIGSGAVVSRCGYYLPFALLSGALSAVGNGLISTFTVSTRTAVWIGFQIVVGAGRGLGAQMSIIALQNAVQPARIPIGLALLVFFQNLGTSITIVISNVIFVQTLTSTIPRYAPSVSAGEVLKSGSGASAVRALIPSGDDQVLQGILKAYSESLRNIFFFLVGISGIAILMSLGMGWKDVRKDSKKENAEEAH